MDTKHKEVRDKGEAIHNAMYGSMEQCITNEKICSAWGYISSHTTREIPATFVIIDIGYFLKIT